MRREEKLTDKDSAMILKQCFLLYNVSKFCFLYTFSELPERKKKYYDKILFRPMRRRIQLIVYIFNILLTTQPII